MPDYILNRITIIGNDVEGVKSFLQSDKSEFDFNNIIPMPPPLRDTRIPMDIISEEHYNQQEIKWAMIQAKLKKGETLNEAERDVVDYSGRKLTQELSDEYKEIFGTDNQHTWKMQNWGVKNNATDVKYIGKDKIEFLSEWKHPMTIIETLSLTFPEMLFEVEFGGDTFEEHFGRYAMTCGVMSCEEFPEPNSEDAIRLVLEVTDSFDYHLNTTFIDDVHVDNRLKNNDEFYITLLEVSIEEGYVNDKMSKVVLETAMQMAVEKEHYEFAADIQKILKNK